MRGLGCGVVLVLVAGLVPGCRSGEEQRATPPPVVRVASAEAHENLNATVWMQTAAEYHAICEQTYRAAEMMLAQAIKMPPGSAVVDGAEAAADARHLAVIMDLDETVLDNSAFQAMLIMSGQEFTEPLWDAFVTAHQPGLVPGAKRYIEAARNAGVRVFFVTNRTHLQEPRTRANLEALGIALSPLTDEILTMNEPPHQGSDKASRRAAIASEYRVVQLIGDDLNDFLSVRRLNPADRVKAMESHSARWGTQWFMLPNPSYGSWERSLFGYDNDADRARKIEAKRNALRVR